jgi:LacI family transcriptional regulator
MSTIFDIAKEAGVSITTVSRALNGYSDVSEITRKRIVEIANSFDYYPSAAARSLQGGLTHTVAFAPLLREHMEAEQFFKEFLGLLTVSAFRHNLSLLATVADDPSHTSRIYKELAGSGRADGIILADIKPQDDRIDLIASFNLPFVAFGRTSGYEKLSYPLVDVDSAAGIRAVVDYLVGRGHHCIAYLGGPLNTSYSLYRYSGYCQGLEKHKIPLDERIVIADLQDKLDTAAAVRSVLAVDEKPTAIVTANDYLAFQAIQELQNSGINVGSNLDGKSVAVTGFDDLQFAAYIQPALTTLRQPIALIADILLDLLVSIIKSGTNNKKKAAAGDGAEYGGPTERTLSALNSTKAEANIKWIGPMQALVEPELVVRSSA